jgi:LmbE family N-acetylglucosaminyl deacetylase
MFGRLGGYMEGFEIPERAMLVIPHPDDGESGCGGTVAAWVNHGCAVLYVICTNGDKGTSDPSMLPETLAKLREREQKRAADILGVHELEFLRYGDGELEDSSEFRERIVRELRRFRPDVVMAMDPYRQRTHGHRDHRVSGQVAMDACFPYARDRLHYPEHEDQGLAPFKVGTILLWGSENPDVAIDIGDTLSTKLKALSAHDSQVPIARENIQEFTRVWSERAAERAVDTDYKYAETFRKLTFRR